MARSALSASLLSVFGSFALLMFQACEKLDSDVHVANDSLSIIVSVPPQADFVQRIGGDHVKVDVLVGLGQDPHNFSPTPSQMAVLSGADLFLTVGMPFEEALSSQIESANAGLKVVSMSEGFEKNLVRGCVSSVWLICERTTEDDESSQRLTLSFRGRSDAQIVSGLVAIVLSRYSGMSPEAILSVKTTSILDGFGLQAHLSPGRRIGLSAMVARIRQFALEAVVSEGESDER